MLCSPLQNTHERYIISRSNVNSGNYGSVTMDAMWFQQALDRAGASQADLARHLRLAPSAISRMLKGERQMKLTEAVQVAAFLGVSQEEVLRHAGDNTPIPCVNAADHNLITARPGGRRVGITGRPS